MTESNGNRTLFQSLRVPFDLKAIFLAFLGLVVLWAGGEVLGMFYEASAEGEKYAEYKENHPDASKEQLKEERDRIAERVDIDVMSSVLQGARERIPGGALLPEPDRGTYRLGTIQFIIGLIWWLVVLSVFGGAVCRVTASRIARDEGVGVREALKFSMGNLQHYLAAPIFVVLAMVFFWACILLAGVVTSIPVIGALLNIIIYPLVILAGLIIVLIGFAGILGLLLMVAAVSAERNGALDAISRAFSYIYSRPLQFFFSYFVIILFAFVILFVGDVFIATVAGSYDTGVLSDDITSGLRDNWAETANTPDFDRVEGFFNCLSVFWIWLLHRILWWGVTAYVAFYVLGGTTSVYFQLRRDVDGTEESEIYLEDGGEDEFDFSVTDTPEAPPPAEESAPAEEAPEEEKAEDAQEEEKEDGEAPEEEEKPEGE